MGRPIKYSTTTPSGSVRKGNMVIGVNSNTSFGPTANTGFYAGIDPPSGGYTIYVNKASGGPSIYIAETDTDLVNITKDITGTQYDNYLECLNYFSTQTDKLVVSSNDTFGNIVTDGLILNLQAGNSVSFVDNKPTTNLVTNPDFNNSTTGWSSNQNTTLSIEPIEGTNFLKVKSNQTTSTPGFKSGNITVTGNTVYTLTIRAYKNDSQGIYLYATGNGTGGSDIVWTVSPNGPNPITNTLTTISRTFTTPADMTYLQIGALWSNPLTTSEVYVEYMQLEQKSYATPFVSGSRSQNTTWYDLSGNATNGTLTNGPTFDSDGVIVFDGVDDYGTNNSTVFNITDNVTLNAWIKESSGGNPYGNYLSKSANNGYRFRRQGVNGPLWLYSSSNSVQGGTLYNDTWYMVTGVFSSTGLRAYINGTLVASNTTAFNPANVSGQPLYIGSYYDAYEPFGGAMASAQIYNKALSQAEILQNYYQAPIVTDGLVFAVDAGNLVSYENGATTMYSLTGSNDAKFYNGPNFVNEYGGGIERDATDDFITGSITVPSTTTSFSVETWFKANPGSSYKALISAWNSGTGGAGGWEFQFLNGILGVHPTYTVTYTANTLVHAVYTQEGTSAKIYINGVLQQTSTLTTDLRNGSIGIGNLSKDGISSGYNLDSTFYAIRVYNKTLTSNEVTQNYNAQRKRFGL